MKTIIMYELLGMVKDGKAPKKIKWGDTKYTLYTDEDTKQTYYQDDECKYFFLDIKCLDDLNDEVEILEEEKKIPEKLKIEQDTPGKQYYIKNEYGTKCGLTQHSRMIAETVNQLIDYLDYIKSKGDE